MTASVAAQLEGTMDDTIHTKVAEKIQELAHTASQSAAAFWVKKNEDILFRDVTCVFVIGVTVGKQMSVIVPAT